MKALTALLLVLLVAAGAQAQDFLGKWKVVRVFTTWNIERTVDTRMLVLVSQGLKHQAPADGVVLPQDMNVEFSINPNNKAQHVTLTSGGLLLMSLNWKERPVENPDPFQADRTLKVWSGDESDYAVYALLYTDSSTLIFSDKSKAGSRYLDIYYLERTGEASVR